MFNDFNSPEFEKEYTYHADDLGAVWSEAATAFRVWAPTAKEVSLCLFRNGDAFSDDRIGIVSMERRENGTWYCRIPGDMDGIFYTFYADFEGYHVEAVDPYAKAVGVNGKRAMVLNPKRANPIDWEKDGYINTVPRIEDAVIYELHLRDISMSPSSGIVNKGRYLALTEENTHTKKGASTGLAHLKELGITHVQILPFFDFGSVDESQDTKQYNWGYDPMNFNAPEGSYSTNPCDGYTRILELKKMISALHRNGIGVIMDVVYNHVYDTLGYSFNSLTDLYFSRKDSIGKLSNASGCGNDTASERSMVRKFIVDSLSYWAKAYHIDGFRFDLVGLLDIETVKEAVQAVRAVNPYALFYGEGWNMPTRTVKPDVKLTTQHNSGLLPDFSFFNDTFRDSLRGSVFNTSDAGFLAGGSGCKESARNCFLGKTYWASKPGQCINYASCHDNYTLYDRLRLLLPLASEEEIQKRSLLSAAFILLSQGVPFFQAGEELYKSKKAPNGKIIENSYRSSDRINSIKWSVKDTRSGKEASLYYAGLISIRKHFSCFRYGTFEEINDHIQEFPVGNPHVIAALYSETEYCIIVIMNADWKETDFILPQGKWCAIAEGPEAGLKTIREYTHTVKVEPSSATVLVQYLK